MSKETPIIQYDACQHWHKMAPSDSPVPCLRARDHVKACVDGVADCLIFWRGNYYDVSSGGYEVHEPKLREKEAGRHIDDRSR